MIAVEHATVAVERVSSATPKRVFDLRVGESMRTCESRFWDGTRLVFTEQGAYFAGFDDVAGRAAGTRDLLESLGKDDER